MNKRMRRKQITRSFIDHHKWTRRARDIHNRAMMLARGYVLPQSLGVWVIPTQLQLKMRMNSIFGKMGVSSHD